MRFLIISFIVGAIGLYLGIQEWRLSRYVKDTPEPITLAELIDKGPGENHHVLLSEFRCGANYVYEQNKKTNKSTGKAWVPIAPVSEEDKMLEKIAGERMPSLNQGPVHAIIKADNIYGEADLDRLSKQDKVDGVVVNLIESLSGDERRLLEQKYPGTDVGKCHIIELGRHKNIHSKMGIGFAMAGGGGLVFLLILLSKLRSGPSA